MTGLANEEAKDMKGERFLILQKTQVPHKIALRKNLSTK